MREEKYTLKMFMETYDGFDFESGTIVLFDTDLCKQYLINNKEYRTLYLTEKMLSKFVYDWKHDDKVMTIILKGKKSDMISKSKLVNEIEKEINGVIVKDTYSRGKNAGLRKAKILAEELV